MLRNKWPGSTEFAFENYGIHGSSNAASASRLPAMTSMSKWAFREELGVLDPFFFARYVSTTPGLEEEAALFGQRVHDPRRAGCPGARGSPSETHRPGDQTHRTGCAKEMTLRIGDANC